MNYIDKKKSKKKSDYIYSVLIF